MSDTRTCHICQSDIQEWCEKCVADFEHRKDAATMTGEDRAAEMRLLNGPMEIPFDLIHKRIEELVGRPVWTHEMGLNWEGLVQEAAGREHPSFDAVLGLIPEEKRVVVVLGDEGDPK